MGPLSLQALGLTLSLLAGVSLRASLYVAHSGRPWFATYAIAAAFVGIIALLWVTAGEEVAGVGFWLGIGSYYLLRPMAARLASCFQRRIEPWLLGSQPVLGPMPAYPARKVRQISKVLGGPLPAGASDILGWSAARDRAFDELASFVLAQPETGPLLASVGATPDLIRALYSRLSSTGVRWVGPHFVPISALCHPSSLSFVIRHMLPGSSASTASSPSARTPSGEPSDSRGEDMKVLLALREFFRVGAELPSSPAEGRVFGAPADRDQV